MAQEAKQTEREGSNETRKQQQQSAAPTASTPTNGSREVVHEPRQFPVRDVEKVCRDMWHAQMAINVCIDEEQSHYNTARSFWNKLPSEAQDKCYSMAQRTSPHMFYTLLGKCVWNEYQIVQRDRPRH